MKHFDFGTGSFTVLAPNGISQNSNDNSLVIKLENGSNSFIFTGDAEETSEQDMISTGMNLDCDVLSVGHHGSASSTTWDFLEATSPSYAVISCGINNQYNHPSADTMGRYQIWESLYSEQINRVRSLQSPMEQIFPGHRAMNDYSSETPL